MNPAVADLISWVDTVPGVQPIPDGYTRTGFVGMRAQEEGTWWYEFIIKQIPKSHWLQEGNTAKEEKSNG